MPALAVRLHSRKERDYAVDGTAEIHGEDKVPILVAGSLDGHRQAGAGVVAKNVNVTEDLRSFPRSAVHGLAVADIERDEMRSATMAGEYRLRLGKMRRFDVGDHHLRAGLQQRGGDAQADAARAAGDEGRLVGKVLHVPPFVRRDGTDQAPAL